MMLSSVLFLLFRTRPLAKDPAIFPSVSLSTSWKLASDLLRPRIPLKNISGPSVFIGKEESGFIGWLRSQRFQKSALNLGRSDRAGHKQVRWLWDDSGNKISDPSSWKTPVQNFWTKLFASRTKSLPEKQRRLAELESAAQAARFDGQKKPCLPFYVFVSIFGAVLLITALGEDGLAYKMVKLLDFPALKSIHEWFEQRLNCIPEYCSPVKEWLEVVVRCTPKASNSHSLTQWRPLCMLSCLSRWYTSCLTFVLKTHPSPPQALLLGFEVGRQPLEITGALRMILQKAHEWGLALIIFKGDVAKAFDAMEHPLLDQSFAARSVPVCLRAATLRERVGLTLKVQLRSVTTDEIPLGKGGPQGGTGTPSWWNFLFDFVPTPVIQSWKQNNFGFDLEDGLDPLSLLGWADDTFWIATSFHDAAIMTQELTYAINDSCFTWKGDSLSFLANDSALEQWPPGLLTDRFYALGRDLCPFTFHRVDEMPALGVLLDRTGSTTRAVEHRVCAGFAHFYARELQFTCRRVSLRKRVLRLFSTVAKSALWGAGGWVISQSLLQRLETVELTLLRRMLSLPRRPGG